MAINKRNEELATIHSEIVRLRKEMVEISKEIHHSEVDDYRFIDEHGGIISLNDLFGEHDELILIHNMGKKCPYCTLWADGLMGSYQYLISRASVALVSPDKYDEMKMFKDSRNWKFQCVSASETTFTADMGFSFINEKGVESFMPGFSTFYKKEGKIFRNSMDFFGPGDFYAPIWHMFDMLKYSDKAWRPNFN